MLLDSFNKWLPGTAATLSTDQMLGYLNVMHRIDGVEDDVKQATNLGFAGLDNEALKKRILENGPMSIGDLLHGASKEKVK